MKKLFLMASLAISLAACGGGSKKKTETPTEAPKTEATPPTGSMEGGAEGGAAEGGAEGGDMEGGGEEPVTP